MKRAIALLLLALLATGSACEEDDPCSNTCFSRFSLYLHYDINGVATYEPGLYTLACTVDGEPTSCNFTIPSDRTAHYDCQGREILAGPDLVLVTFPGTPVEVQVTLTKEGSALIEETYVPEYASWSPNGPDCPSTCEAASQDSYIVVDTSAE